MPCPSHPSWLDHSNLAQNTSYEALHYAVCFNLPSLYLSDAKAVYLKLFLHLYDCSCLKHRNNISSLQDTCSYQQVILSPRRKTYGGVEVQL
jgi:hypothetical protein